LFEVEPRRFVAVDEACVKVNGLNLLVFSAVGVERNRGSVHEGIPI